MTSFRHYLQTTLAGLLLASTLGSTAQAAVLYSQPLVDGGSALDGAYSIAGAFGFQNADAWSLGAASTVTGVRWWGTDATDTNLFVVRLFADPLAASDTFETMSGSVVKTVEAGVSDSAGNPIYRYEQTFSLARSVAAGSGYVSVFLDSDTDPWNWLEGSGGDGVSVFRGVDGAPWDQLPPDLSFALIGERLAGEVSEPPMLALLLIAGVTAIRRSHGKVIAR